MGIWDYPTGYKNLRYLLLKASGWRRCAVEHDGLMKAA